MFLLHKGHESVVATGVIIRQMFCPRFRFLTVRGMDLRNSWPWIADHVGWCGVVDNGHGHLSVEKRVLPPEFSKLLMEDFAYGMLLSRISIACKRPAIDQSKFQDAPPIMWRPKEAIVLCRGQLSHWEEPQGSGVIPAHFPFPVINRRPSYLSG